MNRGDVTAHLEFFKELGVTGVSRDAAWRRRGADSGARTAHADTSASYAT